MKSTEEMEEKETYYRAPLPVWIRAPRGGEVDHYCGLARAKLYELASRGLIKSVSLAERGQNRGTRLFNLQSILDYIDTKQVEQ